MTKDNMREMDKAIGGRIKELRVSMGLSRVQIAEKVSVTQQQFQKYECGLNRISAARLVAIAEALGESPAYFLDGLSAGVEAGLITGRMRDCIKVSRNFAKIKNPECRKAVAALVNSLAGEA